MVNDRRNNMKKEIAELLEQQEELIQSLKNIADEADHIIGTEADYHKEVAIQNAKTIKRIANGELKKLGV